MMQIFRDMHRQAQSKSRLRLISFWGRMLRDMIPSLINEHVESMEQNLMTTMKIDQYEVQKHIENGASSSIYLVKDPVSQRDVIMKLWRPEEELDLNTLKREVDAMMKLKHPNIPEVYDYVENESHPYFVMEYIQGETLLQRVEQSDDFIPEDKIVNWAIQVCDILIHLHSQRPEPYIFRDVKPSNIIESDTGEVHLIDFGITVTHQPNQKYDLIGTEGYAPPEQYTGDVDPRSDIYALGASLHHIATGIDPRPDHNLNAQKFTFTPARSINPKLSPSFASIITRATAYEPAERFQSVEEMQDALSTCLHTPSLE